MCFYRFFYFLFATSWGYSIIKDTDYMPKSLMGKGDYRNAFKNFWFHDHEPELANYFLITAGYHIASLFTHFIGSKKNDFLEMGLHHIVALYLFGGVYTSNFWECGSVLAVLHDVADIGTNWCKFFSDTPLSNFTVVSFLFYLATWFWTRCIVLPCLIYGLWIYAPPNPDIDFKFLIPVFCYLLSIMFMLHCYWFYLFLKMLGKFCKTGKAEDG